MNYQIDACKYIALEFLCYIYEKFNLKAERLTASIEDGIFFNYIGIGGELSIVVKIDLDIAMILVKNRKPLKVLEINTLSSMSINKLNNIIKILKGEKR